MKAMNCLQEGEVSIVLRIDCDGTIRRRLLDMGLTEGTQVECFKRSPSGHLAAYGFRGAVIAIRDGDAAQIFVNTGGVSHISSKNSEQRSGDCSGRQSQRGEKHSV